MCSSLLFLMHVHVVCSDVPSYRAAMEVTLHFEASAKWPDDFDAIQHVKTAFYLKISELLKADQQRYGVGR